MSFPNKKRLALNEKRFQGLSNDLNYFDPVSMANQPFKVFNSYSMALSVLRSVRPIRGDIVTPHCFMEN